MKFINYILLFAFLAVSVPVAADDCMEENSFQCISKADSGNNSDDTKSAKSDICACVFHHMQFSFYSKNLTYTNLVFSSLKFNISHDNPMPSLGVLVPLQPPSLA